MQERLPVEEYAAEKIELKWQARWREARVWEASIKRDLPKYYVLDMFPYPSGRLHMGHVRNYGLGDVIARFRRAEGYNVLHPMGWDAFGLPAENAAIKNRSHPEDWTLSNIESMRKQLERLGLGYDWSREVTTCLPEYYRWEQLIFTQMLEKGLAYRKSSTVNWCPSCQTVLANEQVIDGRCWRCESLTTTRELEQWFLKITAYAEELLTGLDTLEGWPERVRLMQKNWIGRSEGAEIAFGLEEDPEGEPEESNEIRVFTTRPDTLFGVTYMALAPEHPLAQKLAHGKSEESAILHFIEKCRKQDKIARTAEDVPKEGVFTGSFAIHPLTGGRIPIYLGNFVLPDYGTGALMAVPAHDTRDHAFAKKYGIPIREVIRSKSDSFPPVSEAAFIEPGFLTASAEFDGMDSEDAKRAITKKLESLGKGMATLSYRLRDWGLSRQRYWGAPIPVIHCKVCKAVPVPAKDLPVKLPKDIQFTGTGESPLAKHPDFLNVKCPRCGRESRRETDTMDTFMESSWYYLRYLSPHDHSQPFDLDAAAYWLGIDQYIGGIEHATMHLLYFRFFHKVLRDLGFFPSSLSAQDRDEPARRLLNQGIVCKDGAKMSKSKGNVVEPDEIISKYGADTARLFSMFAAPPEKVLEWTDQGVEGASRFLGRVWRMVEKHREQVVPVKSYASQHSALSSEADRKLRTKTHQVIAKIHQDLKGYHFNTSIAAIMELVNEVYIRGENDQSESLGVLREAIEAVVRLLHPFAPHVTSELWERLGHHESLVGLVLPKPDSDALTLETAVIVVQVNGKLRANVEVPRDSNEATIVAAAKLNAKVTQYLTGKTVIKTIVVPNKLVNFVVK